MGKPADSGAGAGATQPLTTQLQQKHKIGNASRQQKQSELQQSPAHSQELINASFRKLSDGLSAFQRCLSELHRHADAVRTSIDSSILLLLRPHTTNTTPPAAAALSALAPETEPSEEEEEEEEEEEDDDEEEEEEEEEEEGEEDDEEEEEEEEEEELKSLARVEPKSPPSLDPKSSCLELKCSTHSEQKSFPLEQKSSPRSERKSPSSEVEILCHTMNSHGLRKYMIGRLLCVKTLRQRVPNALKFSPNPAKLILKSIGKFYTQGSNAYVEGSPLIKERQALVLLLECFLRMIGKVEDEGEGVVEIENGVKEEAQQAAIAWYKRLISEGGILTAKEIDARGLLLLIGCFGIPQAFKNEDIKDLLHQSYIKMISGSLKRSRYLMAKIPEIIEGMLLEQKTVIEAVYFSLCFGLEDRFNPQRLLTSFLHESEVTLLNKINSSEQTACEDSAVGEIINAKRKYLGSLKSLIQCLGRNNIEYSKLLPELEIGEKVIRLEREIAQLRKSRKAADQRVVQKRKVDETELLSKKQLKLSDFPNPGPPQQQRVVNHVDRNNTLLGIGGTAGHIYGHSVYRLGLHGPVAGSIRENVVGSLVGPVGGVGVGGPRAGISGGADVVLGRVDGSYGDATVYGRLPSQRYAYRPSSYLEGPSTITGDVYSRLAPCMENYKGLPSTIPGDFNRPPPHFGGLMGLSNTVPPPYQLADTGPATELYRSSGSRAVESVNHRSPVTASSRPRKLKKTAVDSVNRRSQVTESSPPRKLKKTAVDSVSHRSPDTESSPPRKLKKTAYYNQFRVKTG